MGVRYLSLVASPDVSYLSEHAVRCSEADESSGWTEMVVLFLEGLGGCSAGHATAAAGTACMHAVTNSVSVRSAGLMPDYSETRL